MENKKIAEYDVVRVIVTMLVIVGHCTYYKLGAPNGGCDYTALTHSGLSKFYIMVEKLTAIIYLFHMPLYMALSGALLRHKEINGGGYDSIASLIKDKSKKLLLPFVVVLLLYAVPLKAISGFYAKSTNVFKDILTNEVFIQQGFYLWFLPVLFMIFLIHHIVEKKMHIRKPYKLVFMYVALLLHSVIPINAIRLIAKFIMWFYVGYYFEEYREKANAHISLKTLFIIGSIFVALSYIYSTIHDSAGIDILGAVRLALAPICAVVGCAFVYGISFLLSSTALPATRIFNVLRNNTFGMYLYSDPWNYVVLAVLVHFIGKAVFVADWGSALMYFSRILITGGVSLSFSIFLKKKGIRYIC